ncbi:MAG TPA: SDR family oxidoreductase [Acidimicrobiales bacterium]|nr:SDR family oxidoreductase [Acidimicrobiales bacterium]
MDFGFHKDDVVIVTGAASGIGRATAFEAAAQGLRVAAWDMNEAALAETVALIDAGGGRVRPVVADITKEHDVMRAVEESTLWGAPRYLVNNAGPAHTADLSFDDALAASVGATRQVTTSWLGMGPADGRAVVSVASITAVIGGTGWYPVAKAGIAAYMRTLAVSGSGLRANTIGPGLTDTTRTETLLSSDQGRAMVARNPLRRAGRPEDMAHAALFLLSPASSYINGVLLLVDGGQTLVV